MGHPRLAVTSLVLGALVAGACSAQRENAEQPLSDLTATPVTSTQGSPRLSAPPTSSADPSTSTTRERRAKRQRRNTTTTTTTTLVPYRRAHNPRCVVQIRSGDSLYSIAEASDNPAVTIESLQRENRIRNPNQIKAGDLLDICVRNKINDITGEKRMPPNRPRRQRQRG